MQRRFPRHEACTLPESQPNLALNARCTPLSFARLRCSGPVRRRGSSGLGPSGRHACRAERRGWDGLPPGSVRVQLPLWSRSRMHLGPSLPSSRVCPCVARCVRHRHSLCPFLLSIEPSHYLRLSLPFAVSSC